MIEEFGPDAIDFLRERGGFDKDENDCYTDPRSKYCTQLALAEVVIVATKTFKQLLSVGSSYSELIR